MPYQLAQGGVLTFYLVTTGWVTARRREGETSIFDWGALLFALAVGVAMVTSGLRVASGTVAPQAGVPVGMYFFLGSVALLAAAGDVRMLVRGGVFGAQRVARHLWRMCFGLFIATGSFFIGQQQVFPAFLRKTNVLFIPAILPLILMIFWLFRVRFTNAYKRMSLPRSGDVSATDLAAKLISPQDAECAEAAPAGGVSVLSHSPQRPERRREKPGIGDEHHTLRLTRTMQNRGQRFFSLRSRATETEGTARKCSGLKAKAQSRHSVWDESIESHAGRESVVV